MTRRPIFVALVVALSVAVSLSMSATGVHGLWWHFITGVVIGFTTTSWRISRCGL